MFRKILTAISCVAGLTLLLLTTATSFGQTSTLVQVLQSGSGSLTSASPGPDVIANPEVDPALVGDDDTNLPLSGGKVVNRSMPLKSASALRYREMERQNRIQN